MNPKQKLGLFLAAGLLAFGFAWYLQTQIPSVAPDATFKTIKGESIALADLKGKPVLVTFWATDCPACIEEIPHLISLHQQFSSRDLTIVAVAMDYDPPNHVLAMAEAKQIPYAIALDPTADLAKAFGNVQLTPTSFLINRNGMIVMQKVGAFDLPSLQEQLKNM
ncbi:MAG: TlpA family protein disulfide reductase [Methylococcaceae bacterium]|nr:TlpA family protein disulfide reductase [Methylococcaceae bacterium]